MKYVNIQYGKISIKSKKLRQVDLESEILIRTKYVWLCGSDMHRIRNLKFSQPTIMWHEIVGEVIEAENKRLLWKFVAVNPILSCKKCPYCERLDYQHCSNLLSIGKQLDWGFAEFTIVPKDNILVLAPHFDIRLGILIDGTAVIIHALNLLKKHVSFSGIKETRIAIIWGGSLGGLCWITLQKMLPFCEITIFTKRSQDSLKWIWCLLRSFMDIKSIPKNSYDIIFECVWWDQPDTLNESVRLCNKGGIVLVLWVFWENFNSWFYVRELFYKEILLLWVNSFSVSEDNHNDFHSAYTIIRDNQQDYRILLGRSYPIEEFSQGISSNRNYLKTYFYFN